MPAVTAWAAGSDKGLVRSLNEDSAYAGQWLYAVADGMGGHVAGEVASATVITELAACDTEANPAELPAVLRGGVRRANTAIRQRGQDQPELRTMGTTLTAMLWSGCAYALVHIGDSRAYRLRSGRLRRLTEDHALSNLVAEAKKSPVLAPMMSRFLDGRPDRSPDLSHGEALAGDRYLLCSDGLTAVVSDDAIRTVLSTGSVPSEAVEGLTALAVGAGGPDNITVIVVDVVDPDSADTGPARTLGAAAEMGS